MMRPLSGMMTMIVTAHQMTVTAMMIMMDQLTVMTLMIMMNLSVLIQMVILVMTVHRTIQS